MIGDVTFIRCDISPTWFNFMINDGDEDDDDDDDDDENDDDDDDDDGDDDVYQVWEQGQLLLHAQWSRDIQRLQMLTDLSFMMMIMLIIAFVPLLRESHW